MIRKLSLTCLSLALFSTPALATKSYLVVVIDDLGHKKVQGLRATKLPGKVNMAILPYRKHSDLLLKESSQQGKEILLHAPMSTTLDKDTGEGTLSDGMTREELQNTLHDAIKSLPGLKGINNHMGSQLTQNRESMEWVMETLGEQQLYFLDSRTTAKSVAAETAQQMQVPNLQRDVFLDHQQTLAYVDQAFQKAITLSKQNGIAVAIGHPHKVTMDYLEYALPGLEVLDIELLYISEAIALQSAPEIPQEQKVLAESNELEEDNPIAL